MNLHRSGQKPDWARTPRKRWNEWQKLAAQTDGIITVGNIFTAIGFAGVLYGLYLISKQMYVGGLIAIAAGRLCDLADGWLADATQTKSPLGEKLDAGIDKLETVITVVVLLLCGVVAVWATAALFIPQLAIAVLGYRALRQGKRLPPSKAGKASMALVWVSLVGFVLLAATSGYNRIIACVVYVVVGLAAGTGLYAIPAYYKTTKR
jgi:phosphatidylglycerophosphate synthase